MLKRSFFLTILISQLITKVLFANITGDAVKEIFNFLSSAPKEKLSFLEAKYKISTDIDKLLYIDGTFFKSEETQELLIEEVINHYTVMDNLDKQQDVDENIKFIKSLSPRQIIRIYNLRSIYSAMADELNFKFDPYLDKSELNGIYLGRSSIEFALDTQRSFQKIFFPHKKFGKTYHLGYNVSNLPLVISGHGFFRVYQSSYPIYQDQKRLFKSLQLGSVSLSYEYGDIGMFDGEQQIKFLPKISKPYEFYNSDGEKKSTVGGLIYSNLKDQMFKINNSFLCSFAFRDPQSLLPGTYFIMIKQCELVNPNLCPIP